MNTAPSSAYFGVASVVAATVVSSLCFDATADVAGVEQEERAGAVGALPLARPEAALAEERGLLVAGDAADRDAVGQEVEPLRHAEVARRSASPRGASTRGTPK